MAERRFKGIAANLLTLWTDSDTAMEIVGSSLGIFGEGALDPTIVLANDTPLRNALFDVLLSLVEGGALEMRPLDDGRYAFRWRADIATAGFSRETSVMIDLTAPPANLSEVAQLKAERDEALRREADALGRAEFAEALAAEQRRLLLSAETRAPVEDPPAPTADLAPAPVEPAPVDVPAVDVAPVEVPAVDVPAIEVPAIEVPAIEVPASEVVVAKKARRPRSEPKPEPEAVVVDEPPADVEIILEAEVEIVLDEDEGISGDVLYLLPTPDDGSRHDDAAEHGGDADGAPTPARRKAPVRRPRRKRVADEG